MSIEDEILDRVGRQMLFPLVPKAAGAIIRRAMFVEERLWQALTSPEGDLEWDDRIGRLRADLEVFVVEEYLDPKYLFLLFPSDDAVWEIRSVRDNPSIRVLGLFPLRDAFVSTNFALRETLGGWQSREWKAVKRATQAAWRRLFDPYRAIKTTVPCEVFSGATNGNYYKVPA
jgi:hypothetical protein